MTTLRQQFGSIVRRRRLAAALSQEALARAAGLHFTYISLLETGKRLPSIEVVRKLSVAFSCTMVSIIHELEQDVLGESPRPKTKKKK